MTINNAALYDAVIAGACLNNSVWPSSTTPSAYALPAGAAVQLAAAVDALITTTSVTISMRLLMANVVQDTIFAREALTDVSSPNYAQVAARIVAVYLENLPNLKDTDTGETGASWDEVYYLDSATDSDDSQYYVLQPEIGFDTSGETTSAIALTAGQTKYFVIGSTPTAWIAPNPFALPFIQQALWIFDAFASASNTDGTVTLTAEVYTRDITGGSPPETETLLFSASSDRIVEATAALHKFNTSQEMFNVDEADRFLVKFKASKTGGSTSTTVTLYFQGTTHDSHVHCAVTNINPS